jgi:hypothetical protein
MAGLARTARPVAQELHILDVVPDIERHRFAAGR